MLIMREYQMGGSKIANGKRATHMKVVKKFLGQAPTRESEIANREAEPRICCTRFDLNLKHNFFNHLFLCVSYARWIASLIAVVCSLT